MRDDEAVDDVEVRGRASVHAGDGAVLEHELGLGIVRPVRRDEAELRGAARRASRDRRSRSSRDANRRLRIGEEPSLGVGARRLAHEARVSRGAVLLELRRPLLELRGGRAARAERACRRRAGGRRGPPRARRPARGSRRAARDPPRARPPPGAAASAAWRGSRSPSMLPARAPPASRSASGTPPGVDTRSGRCVPSG